MSFREFWRKNERPILLGIAGIWVLTYAFEVGRSTQHDVDRKEIKAAYQTKNTIGDHQESKNTNTHTDEPAKPSAGQGREHSAEVSAFGIKLGEGLLAIFTLLLYLATRDLAVSTRGLVKGADKTAERQLRAYVSVEPGAVIHQSGRKHLRFEFRPILVNNGATPAVGVRVFTRVGFITAPIPEDFDFSLPTNMLAASGSTTDIGPRKERFSSVIFHRNITLSEARALIKGAGQFHVYGVAEYRDVFGNPWHTNFSFIIFPGRKKEISIWHNTQHHNNATY